MDEMTGALVALAAIAGAAIGEVRGTRRANAILANEREYLRGRLAHEAGETYAPPPPPPGVIARIPVVGSLLGGRESAA